jgi:hypothetical protein
VYLLGLGGGGTTTVGTPAGNYPAGKFNEQLISVPGNDLAWDKSRQFFYVAVPSSASTLPDTIAEVDPTTGQVIASHPTADEPRVLALSDDGQYLYASEWSAESAGTIERFTLPDLSLNISYSLGTDSFLGPLEGWDIAVAPGAPHTLAVSTFPSIGDGFGEVLIYDDAVARSEVASSTNASGASFNSIQWGADAGTLYAYNFISSGFDFYKLSVDNSGPALVYDYPRVENPYNGPYAGTYYSRIHYDRDTGLVYNDAGPVVDPVSMRPEALLDGLGTMTTDAMLGKAYFLYPGAIVSFDLNHHLPLEQITTSHPLPANLKPLRLLRWGGDGLAFVSADGIHLVTGDFVDGAVPAVRTSLGAGK